MREKEVTIIHIILEEKITGKKANITYNREKSGQNEQCLILCPAVVFPQHTTSFVTHNYFSIVIHN